MGTQQASSPPIPTHAPPGLERLVNLKAKYPPICAS
jgi:hypothetical protein